MSFHEIRFPTKLSFGATGGPERRTDIVTLVNGFEERNTAWEHSRRHYDAGTGLRSMDDLSKLLDFFEARRAQLHAFRWKDWADFKTCLPSQDVSPLDQEISRGDGVTKIFQLIKTYSSGGQSYVRPIKKPVKGTVQVAVGADPQVEGFQFTTDPTNGQITFIEAPDIHVRITAGFEFDVPVRFAIDRITTSMMTFNAGEIPTIPIVEVRI